MNQKTLRYFLFAGLSLIWGTIIYRIIDGLGNDNTVIAGNSKPAKFDYTAPKDSFTLIADYPDPFLRKENSASYKDDPGANIKDAALPTRETPPVKPAFDITKIQYYGMIVNRKRKKIVAIISINGKEYMVKEKERIDEMFISSITKGKITILIKGRETQVKRVIN